MSDDGKYVPPLGAGQRVRLLTEYCEVQPGTLGTITWTHPWPDMPYRVKWDGFENVDSGFGMDDIGWLMKPGEVEAVDSGATDA